MVGLAPGPARAIQESAGASCGYHPAEFATELRKLALDAYRVVNDQRALRSDAAELSRRIAELREHTQEAGLLEIDRWLHKALEVLSAHETA